MASGEGVSAAGEASARIELLARVVVNEPLAPLDYRVPEELAGELAAGVPVLVPLRKRRTSAYVVDVRRGEPPAGVGLRDVEGIDPERPRLPEKLIGLLLFAASYYGAREGEMLAAALPALARPAAPSYLLTDAGRRAKDGATLRPTERALLELAAELPRGFTVAAAERRLGCSRRAAAAGLTKAAERGWLARRSRRPGRRERVLLERVPGATADGLARRPALRALLARLPPGERVPLAAVAAGTRGAHAKVKALVDLGLVRRVREADPTSPTVASFTGPAAAALGGEAAIAAPPVPTPAQAAAIGAIVQGLDEGAFRAFLLEGVTGSGKTEVYLRVIAHALELRRSALVLVPEIALTPQLGAAFAARFGARVAVFHSGLSPAERRDEWERVARGEVEIGLGARSALFLPLARLGLIVVDEEHETTFKQDESPRYNARDLAVARAKAEGAVVVLGSATPSLETRANADAGRYRRLVLGERVQHRPLPEVERVSLAAEPRACDGMLTERLARALERTLAAGEQAILYLNRRGFAPYVYCRDCGHAYRCADCDVALTLHRRRGALVCHYCGHDEPAPDECDGCRGHGLIASGAGVEKLEAELEHLFGRVEVARLDRDAVRTRGHLVSQLARFRSGSAKVLIGTQMVTKGHDFPGVTLVGVVLADASLNFPDFRAAERTFQLLTQVAGRAGRGDREGLVVVQGYDLDHYAIATAARHDYARFAELELACRRELGYPPFTRLALVRLEGAADGATEAAAAAVASELRERAARLEGVHVLGPAPSPIARLRGLWRRQVLVKSATRGALRRLLAPPWRPPRDARQVLDVDPYSML